MNDICDRVGTNNPIPPNQDTALLEITSILRADNCNITFPPCPSPNGGIIVTDLTTEEQEWYTPREFSNDPVSFFNRLPVGHEIQIAALFGTYIFYSTDKIDIKNVHDACAATTMSPNELIISCSFIMRSEGAHIEVNWHYECVPGIC